MFNTILIANRGEIACRIAATARRMGIRTVAVYSDADAGSRHVAACDVAVHIGGSEPRDSYLRGDVILDVARQTGAQAIHPGYGFLAENESFARDCAEAGVVFIGPPDSAIAAMGSKSAAKALMEKAGVPLVPGYHGSNQDADFLQSQADAMGYPVLIKASAGGGGKGMRIVASSAEFSEALISCKREAASSFGDDTVLLERYLQKPRHIEIQVFADTQGNVLHLFERDCSVQRRHQKVIEEAPAPGMTPERRKAMGDAAIAAARAVNYVGAGTVEFIVEPDGRFYFMEMNTRLQVEHPVTELITGHDLVKWQLLIAAGQPLPATQDELSLRGHAIEARIYAENPDNNFLPSIGTLAVLNFPEHVAFTDGDIRVDGGVQQGDTISPFYDPMIAKLIVRGDDRDQARARMIQVLEHVESVGVHTNISFLRRLMLDDSFAKADLDTGLIERQHDSLFPPQQPASEVVLGLVIATLLAHQSMAAHDTPQTEAAHADPWAFNDGWRLSQHYSQPFNLVDGDTVRTLTLDRQGAQWTLSLDAGILPFQWEADQRDAGQYIVTVRLDGTRHTATTVLRGKQVHIFENGLTHVIGTEDPALYGETDKDTHHGGLVAPMPGKIIAVDVKAGDTVTNGQRLLVMEAMKMEHAIHAPADGNVDEVFFAVGDQVDDGAELIALST